METADHADVERAIAAELNKSEAIRHAPDLDNEGYDCPTQLVGRLFLHGKRGTLYKVVGWAWDGERDLWMVIYHNVNPNLSSVPYARKVSNFVGHFENGHKRFVEIHDVTSVRPPPMKLPDALDPYSVQDGDADARHGSGASVY